MCIACDKLNYRMKRKGRLPNHEPKPELKLYRQEVLTTGTYTVLVRELERRRKSDDIGVSITHDLFTAVVNSAAYFVQLFLAGRNN